MTEESLSELAAELIRSSGHEVSVHTAKCVEWGLTHRNCEGCSSELGCAKLTKWLMIGMLPSLYEARNFEEFQKIQTRVEELHKSVMSATSVQELRAIPNQ